MNLRSASSRAASRPARSALPHLVLASLAALGMLAVAAWSYATGRDALLLATSLVSPALAVVVYRGTQAVSREAHRLALTDRLTGLGNDRAFADRLVSALDESDRTGGHLAVCLIDIDDFKRINDRFGHPVGDRVLAQVARLIRGGGEGFRLGGDEFALLLPGLDADEARAVSEAVLERIAGHRYEHGGTVTASGGVACYLRHKVDREELVPRADVALYRAKRAGKNTVTVHRAETDGPAPGAAEEDGRNGVATLAARVARRLGFPPEQAEQVRVAGLLSDIGQLALPDEILRKPGPLSDEERRAVERHPRIGYEILDSLRLGSAATWVLHHHERWDGGGYPERLAGERIPLASRILFVADAYDAMTTDQAWRPRLSEDEALAELVRCAGTQFDPLVVDAFLAEAGRVVNAARAPVVR